MADPDLTEREELEPSLWWGGPVDSEREAPVDSAAFRNCHEPESAAWLDQVLSHSHLPRCLVIGLAGAGKTVLLEHLATVLATDERAGDPANPRHRVDRAGIRGAAPIAPIPVLHRASALVEHLRVNGGGTRLIREALASLLASADTFGSGVDRASIAAGIDAGRYVFLFDGLDEVPSTADRRALVDALGGLQGAYPRVVLTTRPGSHTAVERPAGFVAVEVAPLDQEAATRLATAWVGAYASDENVVDVIGAVESVRGQFPPRGREPSPVESPLLLNSLLWVYKDLHRLPRDVASLYREMVRRLCRRRLVSASDLEGEAAAAHYHEALRALFRAAQEQGTVGLSLGAAREVVAGGSYAPRDAADAWLERLANHTALIRFEGAGPATTIRPWHRSYQEYLAAESLVYDHINRVAAGVALLRQARQQRPSRLLDPNWRGTLGFVIGAAMQTRAWGVELVAALLRAAGEGGADQARLYRLVAEGVDEYAADFADQEVPVAEQEGEREPVRDAVTKRLVADFEAHGREWPLADRIWALEALGRLGDPRLGDVGQDSEWVAIAGGRARLGVEREVEVMAFELLWRPVTVWDYRAFVADPGFGTWFEDADPTEPEEWGAQLGHPNRPVVGVSWHEATAYARWMSARTGWRVRLPTEAEWALAARGPDGDEYPWGEGEPGAGEGARANYAWGDGSVGAPSPVGAFPLGNRGRLVDLAGNVWEWCLDTAGSERVLRGGSWSDSARDVRAAARGAWRPEGRYSSFGFRLARGHQATSQAQPGRAAERRAQPRRGTR